MTVTGRITKTSTDTRPLYAAAGVGDLAVERLRHRLAALRGALTVEPRTGTGSARVQERCSTT